MKVLLRVLAIGLLIGAFVLPARAAEFRSSEDSITIADNQKPHDLYLAGTNITVDAPTTGDLVIAGGTALVNGEVENSLFIAGGTVTVRSHVLHHVRIMGGTITLSGKIEGDVFIAGGEVTLTDSAEIGGGLYVASGTVNIGGTVKGELRVGSGKVVIDGTVGSAKVYGDEIRLTGNARVMGDFNYHAAKPATIDSSAVITGQTTYTEYQTGRFDKYGFLFGAVFTLGYLLRLLGTILLGWILIRFWPRTSRKVADFASGSPMVAIGYGLLTLLVVFLGGLVLAFTVIGMSLAGFILAMWVLMLMIGSMAGKILLGSWLYRLFKRKTEYQLTLGTVAIGVVASALLMLVPVVGQFIVFVVFLLGVGSVFNLLLRSRETA